MARILVAGCGFVGLATARLFHRGGYDVIGLVSHEESARKHSHERFPVHNMDLTDREALKKLGGSFDVVINCAAPEESSEPAYQKIYLDGNKALIDTFAPAKILFTGSTSVYTQVDGSWVTEDAPALPERATGKILREAEDIVLKAGGYVARLSGIYGPGRSVLLRKFLDGSAIIEGDGSRIINQVHRDDAAGALFYLIAWHCDPGIYNVTDDSPVTQFESYQWLSEHFKVPIPPSGPVNLERKRGWNNRLISNAKLHATGWRCRYPSFKEAVAEIAPSLVVQGRAGNVLRSAIG